MATVAAVAVLTACGNTTTGHPNPATTPPTETSTTEHKKPYSLARLCELITPEEAQSLGGSPEGKEGHSTSDGHAICQWSDETSLIVGWQTGTSTAQADSGPGITNTPMTIDGLSAVQALSTDTVVMCEILVDLPSGKMVAAGALVQSRGEGKYDPCQVATQLTNLIIPRVRNQ